MPFTSRTLFASALIFCGLAATAPAGADGNASAFTRIDGGAVYDLRSGIDGGDVSEGFALTHVVCTDGSKHLRVMLPVGLDDDGTVFASGGPASTLRKKGNSYSVSFKADGKRIDKTMELKPVNIAGSQYERQFMLRLDYGDALWKALTSDKDDAAVMLIGQGGRPLAIPADPKLDAALKSCGLRS